MFKGVRLPGESDRYSYNSDKHDVIEAVYQIFQKTRHKLSKEEIWIMINEYEGLLKTFILEAKLPYRWFIPKVGFIELKKKKKGGKKREIKTFNEEFLKIM